MRAVLALVVLLALAGATYQGVTTSLERRRLPHPGRLVGVGGHQLQIHCTGAGRPTVVLEAPAAGVSVSWSRVQAALAPLTRVCSYDRAGLGWSERGDDPFDPALVPDELRALLEGAREPAPYVIVGSGLGAAFAAGFSARFPDVTVAAVLLDPPEGDKASPDREVLGRVPEAMPWLARVGLLRLTGEWSGADPAIRAFMNRPDHLTRAARELGKWNDAVRLAERPGDSSRATPVPTTTAALPAPITTEGGAEAAVAAIRPAIAKAKARRSR
jgi:pimeloyl-ACP methyl ester carboxylesterase